MDRREALKTIAAELAHGGLTFPGHVDVILRVRDALDDPDCHVETATRLVKAEPLLSARVVALANSVALNPSGQTTTEVRTAIARVGFNTVRALASGEVVRQLAGLSPVAAHRALAMELWEHTAHVAALAQIIARRMTRQDAETAMFAGIVHEVGGFYLIYRAKDFPALLASQPIDQEQRGADEEDAAGPREEEGEGEVGRAVLKALSVPAPVVAAIEALWQGYLDVPPVTLGDALLIADQLAPVASPLRQLTERKREGTRAIFDMLIGHDMLVEILKASAQEVESVSKALRI
jgi:HD-like signal output (HDOD) protein